MNGINWRSEPATEKQLQAIKNLKKGWKIDGKKFKKKPKTKGEAFDMIQKLTDLAGEIKKECRRVFPIHDDEALYRQEMGDMEGDPYFYGQ